MFFGYSKMHSVTAILFDLGLPCFDTLMHNYRYSYRKQWLTSFNAAIYSSKILVYVYFYCVLYCVFYTQLLFFFRCQFL